MTDDLSGPKPALSVSLEDARVVDIRWYHKAEVYWHALAHERAEVRVAVDVGDGLREGTICHLNILTNLVGIGVARSVVGISAVHPKDMYSRRIGRRVSLASAMKSACGASGLSKHDREQIWTGMRGRGW